VDRDVAADLGIEPYLGPDLVHQHVQLGEQGVVRLRRGSPEGDVADVVERNQGDMAARMHDALVAGIEDGPLQVQDLVPRTCGQAGITRPAASASVFQFCIASPAGPLMHRVDSCSAIST
jgi:hypothetical protein